LQVGFETVTFTAVVLASGTGTLAKALIDAQTEGNLAARVVALGVDRPAGAQEIARDAGIATFAVYPKDFPDRDTWNVALAKAVEAFEPDLVVSAGFMRILGGPFLAKFGDSPINTHPSLLPMFPGAHAVADALAAGAKMTGCTVHKVDAGMDTGQVLAQRMVPVEADDTLEVLHERIKTQERTMLVEVVDRLARGRLKLPV
jgi:phosphoribosylglycinamide formyltransferase-1